MFFSPAKPYKIKEQFFYTKSFNNNSLPFSDVKITKTIGQTMEIVKSPLKHIFKNIIKCNCLLILFVLHGHFSICQIISIHIYKVFLIEIN